MDTSADTHQAAELVEEGIAALTSGRKAQARLLLGQALEADPHSEKGWLWLSGAVDTDEERRFCLRQVLFINEHNSAAGRGLRQLGPGFARSPIAPSTTTAQPEGPAAIMKPEPLSAAAESEPPTTIAEPEPPAAIVEPEPPAGVTPVWSQWRQEAASVEAAKSTLPKGWLVVAAILVVGIMIGLALLFVINLGIWGR